MKWLCRSFVLLLSGLFTLQTLAQSTAWEWIPTDEKIYPSLEYSEGLLGILIDKPGEEDDYLMGYMNAEGKMIIPPRDYDFFYPFKEGLAHVNQDKQYGFINRTGDLVIPFEYDRAESFSEGLAAVRKDGRYGYLNTSGEWAIPPAYDYALSFSEGLAAVELDKKIYFINKKGDVVLDHAYLIEDFFSEGLVGIKNEEGLYGFMNKKGEIVIPCQYYKCYRFSEGLAKVKEPYSLYGFIDKKGEVIIPLDYTDAYSFSEGLAAVEVDGKFGYINKEERMIIAPKYDRAGSFSGGVAQVSNYKDNSRRTANGYINLWGEEITPFIFDNGYTFNEGICKAYTDEQQGYIRYNAPQDQPLAFPNTADWAVHDLSKIAEGLTIKLPKDIKFSVFEGGLTIYLNEVVSYSIGTMPLDMQRERNWLEEASNRWGLLWLIDTENEAYYTGLDLSAPRGHQRTHSCYTRKVIDEQEFSLNADGITIDEGDVHNVSQEECLMLLSAFRSLQKS